MQVMMSVPHKEGIAEKEGRIYSDLEFLQLEK
jgi:hypothetical protein